MSSSHLAPTDHPREEVGLMTTDIARRRFRSETAKTEDLRVRAESMSSSTEIHRLLGGDVKDMIRASKELNEKSKESKSVRLSLKLDADEIHLLKKIFGGLALNDKMGLMEILSFSIYKDVISLGKYFKGSIDEISEAYCADFLAAYISILAKGSGQDSELLEFHQRGLTDGKRVFFISLHEFALRLKDTASKLKKALSERRLKIPSIENEYRNFEKKTTFFCKIIEHKDALACFGEYNLDALKEYFPGVELLNNSSSNKTTQDLNDLITFISQSFRSCAKKRIYGNTIGSFEDFQRNLNLLSTAKNKMKVIQNLKKTIAKNISMMHQPIDHFRSIFISANSTASNSTHWNLSAKETSAKLGTCGPQAIFGSGCEDRTVRQFANQTLSMSLSANLERLFWYNILQILDYQIIQTITSTYIPTDVCANRINFLIQKFFDIATDPNKMIAPDLMLVPRPTFASLNGDQLAQLAIVFVSIKNDFNEFDLKLFSISEEINLHELFKDWIIINKNNRLIFAHTYVDIWFGFLTKHAALFSFIEELFPKLDELRLRHCKLIEKFLGELDKSQLAMNKKEWIAFFQEESFQASLSFCPYMLVATHAKMLGNLHADLSKVGDERDLLEPSMVRYMTLSGIEEIVDNLILDLSKTTPPLSLSAYAKESESKEAPILKGLCGSPESKEMATAQPALTNVKGLSMLNTLCSEKKTSPAKPTSMPPKVKASSSRVPTQCIAVDDTPFAISYGEKVRVILSRLRKLGYLCNSIKGSHIHMQKDDIKLTVPRHGNDDHLAPGTARAIARAVNGLSGK